MKFSTSKNSIGVNISDHSIKMVELSYANGQAKIVNHSHVVLEVGIVKHGRIINEEKLTKLFKEALLKASPKSIKADEIYFAIPERQAYSHVFNIDAEKENEINNLVKEEALNSIPLNREDLIYSFKIVEKCKKLIVPEEDGIEAETKSMMITADDTDSQGEKKVIEKNKIRILISAVDRNVIDEWRLFFEKNNIKIKHFDLELISTFRGFYKSFPEKPVCLVDIGANNTNIGIFSRGGLTYSHTLNVAGNFFTKKLLDGINSLEEDKKYTHEQVGKLKRQIGMLSTGSQNDVAVILKSAVLSIIDEISIAVKYYNKYTGKIINNIVFVGGSSKINGLVDYIKANLSGLKYELKIVDKEEGEKEKKEIEFKLGAPVMSNAPIELAEAIGLAIQKYDKNWQKQAIKLPLEFDMEGYDEVKKTKPKEDGQESEGDERAGKTTWIKEHMREFQLIVILLIGVMAVGWAFWYRGHSAKQRLLALKQDKKYEKSIDISVKMGTDISSYTKENIRGRIFKDDFDEPYKYDELLEKSIANARIKTKKGEILWEENLSITKEDSLIFPLTVEWLIYNEKDAGVKFISKAKESHGNNDDFEFKNFAFQNLEKKKGDYYLVGVVNIMTKEDPGKVTAGEVEKDIVSDGAGDKEKDKNEQEDENSEPVTEEIKSIADLSKLFAKSKLGFVSIDDSGLEWLNARSGPGTNNQIVDKIYPGNVYELIEAQEEWLKIKISEDKEGWVFREYASILE